MKLQKKLNIKLLRELRLAWAQLISIAAVIGIGIAVLFGFRSTYTSLDLSRNQFYSDAQFADVFARVKKAPLSILQKVRSLEGVQQVDARLEFDSLLFLKNRTEPGVGRFISIPDGLNSNLNQLLILEGQRPRAQSLSEVVVSEGFFKWHQYKLGDRIQATLNGQKREFQIVGVGVSPDNITAHPPGSPLPDDVHFALFWINASALSMFYDMESSFNSVSLRVSNQNQLPAVKQQLDQILDRYGSAGAFDRSQQPSAVSVENELTQLQVQALTIPFLFFIAAAFILNIVISRQITAQRAEIATLKAVGYYDREIGFYYFKYAGLIVTIGTLIGLGVGAGIGKWMIDLYGTFFHFPSLRYLYSVPDFLIAFVIALVTVIAGVWSSLRRLFQLPPAEAMRPPAPVSYRNDRLDQSFWFQNLATQTKLTVRSILSSALKTFASGLGFCFAIVILITGLFWSDSMDRLTLIHYRFEQRETGSIQTTHPLERKAVTEIANLSGVLYAEGYRRVPVKVRFENKEKHTALTGFPLNPKLRSLVNPSFRNIVVPENEILVSRVLVDQLGFQTGDTIEVEVVEEKKPKFQLKVTRVVDLLMSNELITSRSHLRRVIQSDDRVDQILFQSIANEAVLHTQLKEMPHVLNVSYKLGAMKFFEENAETFLIYFAAILSFFAGIIAFGVTFNSLRVTLAERDWELATLRILGFTKPEVFKLLLLEVVFVFFAFLPLGIVMSYYSARWLLSEMMTDAFSIPFVIDKITYFWATSVVLMSIAVSGFFIYRLIAKSDMVETLKARS